MKPWRAWKLFNSQCLIGNIQYITEFWIKDKVIKMFAYCFNYSSWKDKRFQPDKVGISWSHFRASLLESSYTVSLGRTRTKTQASGVDESCGVKLSDSCFIYRMVLSIRRSWYLNHNHHRFESDQWFTTQLREVHCRHIQDVRPFSEQQGVRAESDSQRESRKTTWEISCQ